MRRRTGGFTLVEILIVVVILGILAAIVVPQYLGATEDASKKAAVHEVQRLRKAVEVYLIRHGGRPDVDEGDKTWGSLLGVGDYLKSAPVNPWVGGENAGVIEFGEGPDDAYQSDYGWIYNEETGEIWAGGFDGEDNPLPKE
jgi:general secretion pathway protein G